MTKMANNLMNKSFVWFNHEYQSRARIRAINSMYLELMHTDFYYVLPQTYIFD